MGQHSHVRASMTQEIEDEILTRIADGESLLRICGADRREGMPNRVTVHKHLRESQSFRQAYLVARDAQAANIAEQAMEIADGKLPEEGRAVSVDRDKLRVSVRQWLVGVMAPRVYTEKEDVLTRYENWYEDQRRRGLV